MHRQSFVFVHYIFFTFAMTFFQPVQYALFTVSMEVLSVPAQILLNIRITHCLGVSSCSNLWSYTLLLYCPLFTCSEAEFIFLISLFSAIYNGMIRKNIYDLVLQLPYEVKKKYNFSLDTRQLKSGGGRKLEVKPHRCLI